MPAVFDTSNHTCEAVEFGADDVGEQAVTFYGDFRPTDEMSSEEVSNIVNDPLFADLFRLACANAKIGTPLFQAFERERDRAGRGEPATAILRFQPPKPELVV